MARFYAAAARVIPILLYPVTWQSAPFGQLQALPANGQPISTWHNRDEAWEDVVVGIRLVIEDLSQHAVGQVAWGQRVPEPAGRPSIWTIPYPRNPVFTGREELLVRLAQHLRTGQPMALSQPQAISGLGGIGKTQLAVEYAYRHAADYQAVLWARAESHEALTASFVDLAAALHLPQQNAQDLQITVNAVKNWLRT